MLSPNDKIVIILEKSTFPAIIARILVINFSDYNYASILNLILPKDSFSIRFNFIVLDHKKRGQPNSWHSYI